ncbi:hypothetical protein [Nocardioides sp. AX2bis]|uniref:hypothetical protein n=1 Tax=Nocardioides sp. AX2bis TaxID=2653157 RepID=UPI0012F3F0E4|nr:hypothetical protein [Nocardioides sp. AX2bis]VXB16989.1 conserved exported hypothetical protein [Nocardioides sp. AX2bis]
MNTLATRRTAAAALLAGTTALGLLTTTAPANASGDDRVERTGQCSGSARWDLKVKTDNGGLEVEGEVDSNVNGQTWSWRILHNGSVSARGTATTRGPSGSFSVERHITDLSGTDRVTFAASRNGQTCRGSINF